MLTLDKLIFMHFARGLTLLLISSGFSYVSCSQPANPGAVNSVGFAGSTPCDSFIRSATGISSSSVCDFIKWQLALNPSGKNAGSFELTALYGESQPNTNGFISGGSKLTFTGNYIISIGVQENPHARVYQLQDSKAAKKFILIELDENIFHFADNDKQLLVGNGGFGYVLNRLK